MADGPLDRGHPVGGAAVDQADEALRRVHDREPGPAVAQEVLVERPLDRGALGDRDRLASITSATEMPSIRLVTSVWAIAAWRRR